MEASMLAGHPCANASETLKGFNKLIDGVFTGPPITMKWVGGGDMASIASSLALSGCASPCPCPMCEVPRTDLCELDVRKAQGYTKRTLQRILLLAHAIEGKCPGCKYKIVKVVTQPDKELKGRGLTWLEMHFGVAYGKYPLYKSIDPSDWVSCILHLNLRIVGGLITKQSTTKSTKTKWQGRNKSKPSRRF